MYGQPLVVPGEFFPSDTDAEENQLQNLRQIAKQFAPCRPTRSNHHHSYIPTDLMTCKFVFIREDASQPPLSSPYKGPYLVLSRKIKCFQVQLDTRTDWISIDRLKPAYIDAEQHSHHTTTRSGRVSRPTTLFNT